jgi:phosphoribosyl-ATP pyrophosphohydrolase/phosphoribosyl-AMP cyclohydrolase
VPEIDINKINWNEKGLLPVILQHYLTGKVLMVAYMNKEALGKTLATRVAWFWSRSRKTLWQKGETSGNVQRVINLYLDCDQDTLLLKVDPQGPACHLGTESCFGSDSEPLLEQLKQVLAQRNLERPEKSYSTYLFTQGLDKILKKVGEEAAEVIIAAKNNNPQELAQEAADLIYHLMVLFEASGVAYEQVWEVLQERMK